MRVYDSRVPNNGAESNDRITVFVTIDSEGNILSKTFNNIICVDRTGLTFVIHKDDIYSLDNYKVENYRLVEKQPAQ